MRVKSLLNSVLALCLLATAAVGCTGGGDDDDGADPPDAGVALIDAAQQIDAGNANPPATGVGQACGQGEPACPANHICAALGGQADMTGFCTKQCGTGPDPGEGVDPTAPAGGDAMCTTGYTGTVGMPVCGLFSPSQTAGQLDWYCVVVCGAGMQCPGGTTCSASGACDH